MIKIAYICCTESPFFGIPFGYIDTHIIIRPIMKISRFLVATLLCGALSSPVVVAQSAPSSLRVSPEWSETQQAKVRFVHGFYTAYMSGIVYQVDGLTDV